MTPEDQQKKTELEQEIAQEFSQTQKDLELLLKEYEIKKQEKDNEIEEKNDEIQEIKQEFDSIKKEKIRLETMTSLQEAELNALKNRLESLKDTVQTIKAEITDLWNEKTKVLTTYELLKDSNSHTYISLINIISTNPKEFKDVPWETAEKKLEYIFSKIRESIKSFLKNKLWESETTEEVIDKTIAPAFERSLMELLRDRWNKNNVGMLKKIDKISLDSLMSLFQGLNWFAKKYTDYFISFRQWTNAIDYLSVHNWVLKDPNKSEVLSNPLKFKEYMKDPRFDGKNFFSPYTIIQDNIFKVDENQNFEFGMSLKDKQTVLLGIWNIQVVNDPKTTSWIVKLLDKPEKIFNAASWFQSTANNFLDLVDFINPYTKIYDVDIFKEIKEWGNDLAFRVLDFVCKLVWITWWLDWIIKKWRMEKMDLTNEKNKNISQIFKEYQETVWENKELNITDEASCKTALNDFAVTDLDKESSTKWDFLRDSIAENMNISLISPAVIQETLWDSYLKQTTENWETTYVVDESKLDEENKTELMRQLAQKHLKNMKEHLERYNENDLSDFYTDIKSTEDIALCITASLYVDKDDVVEWVKAKVFLPENYWVVYSNWTTNPDESWDSTSGTSSHPWRENLDSSVESWDKQKVSEQWIYDKAVEFWITDNRQIAYVLSTVKWECNYKNQSEIWKWIWKQYWVVDQTTGQAYYGRWFVQLTWKSSYEKFTQIIRDSWKEFKDNNGDVIKWSDVDLVNNPDLILQNNELAAFILMYWMKNWDFTWKKLDDFINDTKTDFYNARSIINWMTSKPQDYADNAQAYLSKLDKSTDSSQS